MLNPMALMKLKPGLEKFRKDHPKLLDFFMAAADRIDEGSVFEVSIKNTEGKVMKTNILINESDVKLFEEAKKALKG